MPDRASFTGYRGFFARYEFSREDGEFVGHIDEISDIVGFHSETLPGLQKAFEEAVDDYLTT